MRKFPLNFVHGGKARIADCTACSINGQYIEVSVSINEKEIINHTMPMIPIEDVVVKYNSIRKVIEIGDRVRFNFTKFGVD